MEPLGLVISLGVVQMGLTVDEAIWAATRGGALSLGLEDRGQIKTGAPADLVVLDAPAPAHIPYRPASNLTRTVIKEGSVVTG
jgi:imidazolonepropionase